MILYPSVDDLLEREDSRYSLIVLADKRARDLDAGSPELLSNYKSPKNIGHALEEIAAGKVKIKED